MAIVGGIDEAGYGPVLGPLVVSGVAFRVPDEQAGACLWDTLNGSVCSRMSGRNHRLVVADSKKLYRSGDGLVSLERAALVMLEAAGYHPRTWRALLERLAASQAIEALAAYPWYSGADLPLPFSATVADIGTRANAVRRDMQAHQVEFFGGFCEPLLAGQFNALARATRNKSVVLVTLVMRIVDRIIRLARGERVCVHIDRLGGRQHYREPLQTAFPSHALRILEESSSRSAYRLASGAEVCEVEFVTGGEARRFPIALASIYSKYLRELYMHAFNSYWSERQTGLRPTAGYYTDAQRWLREAEPAIRRLTVERDMLVRSR